mgnify:CR=1 FL=1
MKTFSEHLFLLSLGKEKIEISYTKQEKAKATLIICHPHSQMGGTMNNKVVTTVMKAGQELNFNTVRFNFRGVGQSSGAFSEGTGEAEDLLLVIDWAKNYFNSEEIILAGFSFGAFVALTACQTYEPDALILIAPPIHYPDFFRLSLPDKKNFLIVAKNDEITDTKAILIWADKKKFNEILCISDASHFFHGKLLQIRDFIIQVLSINLESENFHE